MPIRKEDYPPDWPAITAAIRARAGEERDAAGNITREARCEWCSVENHAWVIRDERGEASISVPATAVPLMPMHRLAMRREGYIPIVLTTAHVDRNRTNNNPDNLASLCQRCHLNHDRAAQHIPHRKYGRYYDREPQGKLKF